MNRIFKVIWSKTRGCYVAVSELAKTHSHGSTQRARIGSRVRATIAATAAIGLLSSLGTGVLAQEFTENVTIAESYTLTVNGTANFTGAANFSQEAAFENISKLIVSASTENTQFTNGLTIGSIAVTEDADAVKITGGLTATGVISGTSITDGTASLADGALTGLSSIDGVTIAGDSGGNLTIGGTAVLGGDIPFSSEGFEVGSSGAVKAQSFELNAAGNSWTSAGALTTSGAITAGGTIEGTSLTDGIATLTGGAITGLTSINNTTVSTLTDAASKVTALSYAAADNGVPATTTVSGNLTASGAVTASGFKNSEDTYHLTSEELKVGSGNTWTSGGALTASGAITGGSFKLNETNKWTADGGLLVDATQLDDNAITGLASINGTSVTDIQGAVTKTTAISYTVGDGTKVTGALNVTGAITGGSFVTTGNVSGATGKFTAGLTDGQNNVSIADIAGYGTSIGNLQTEVAGLTTKTNGITRSGTGSSADPRVTTIENVKLSNGVVTASGFKNSEDTYHLTREELKVAANNTWTSSGNLKASGTITAVGGFKVNPSNKWTATGGLTVGDTNLRNNKITGLESINSTSVNDIQSAVKNTAGIKRETLGSEGAVVSTTTVENVKFSNKAVTDLVSINGTSVDAIQAAVTNTSAIEHGEDGTTIDGVTMDNGAITAVTGTIGGVTLDDSTITTDAADGLVVGSKTTFSDDVTLATGKTFSNGTASLADGAISGLASINGTDVTEIQDAVEKTTDITYDATNGTTIDGVTIKEGTIKATGGLTVDSAATFKGATTFEDGITLTSGETFTDGVASLTSGVFTGLASINGTEIGAIQNTVARTIGITRAATSSQDSTAQGYITSVEGLFNVNSLTKTATFNAGGDGSTPITFSATGIKVGTNSAYVQPDGFRAGTNGTYGQLMTGGLTVGVGASGESDTGTKKATIDSGTGNIATAGTVTLGNGAIDSGTVTLSSDGTNLVSNKAIKSENGFIVSEDNKLTSTGIKAAVGSIAGMTFDSAGITTADKNIDAGTGTVSATTLKATSLTDGSTTAAGTVAVKDLITDHGNVSGITRASNATTIEDMLTVTKNVGFGLANEKFSVDTTGNITTAGNIVAGGTLTIGSGAYATTLTSDADGFKFGDKTVKIGNTTIKSGEIDTGTDGNVKTGKINGITVTGATATGLTIGTVAHIGGTNPFSSTGFAVDADGDATVNSLKIKDTSYGIDNTGKVTAPSVQTTTLVDGANTGSSITVADLISNRRNTAGITRSGVDNAHVTTVEGVLKVNQGAGFGLVNDKFSVDANGNITAAGTLTIGSGSNTTTLTSNTDGLVLGVEKMVKVGDTVIKSGDITTGSNGKVTTGEVLTGKINGITVTGATATGLTIAGTANIGGTNPFSSTGFSVDTAGNVDVKTLAVSGTTRIATDGAATLKSVAIDGTNYGIQSDGDASFKDISGNKLAVQGLSVDSTGTTVDNLKVTDTLSVGSSVITDSASGLKIAPNGGKLLIGDDLSLSTAGALAGISSIDGVTVSSSAVADGLTIGAAKVGGTTNAFSSTGFTVAADGATTVTSLKIGTTDYGISDAGVLTANDGSTIGGVSFSEGTVTGTTLKDKTTNKTIGIGDVITDHGNIAGIVRSTSASSYKTTVEGLFTVDAATNSATFKTFEGTPVYFTSKGIKVGNNSAYVSEDGFRAGTAGTYSDMTSARLLLGTGAVSFGMTENPTYGTNTFGLQAANGNLGTQGTVMIGATAIDNAGAATGGVTLSKNTAGQLESDAAIKAEDGFIVSDTNQLTEDGLTATHGSIAGMTFDDATGITTNNLNIDAGIGKVTAQDIQATTLWDNADPSQSIAVADVITDHANVGGITRDDVHGVTTIEETFIVDRAKGIGFANDKFAVDLDGNITAAGTLTLGTTGGTNTLTASTDGLILTGNAKKLHVGDTVVKEDGVVTEDVTATTATLGDFKFDGSAVVNKNGATTPLTIQNLSITDKAIEGIGFDNKAMTNLESLDGVKVTGTTANGLTFGDGAGAATVGGTENAFSSTGFKVDTVGNVTAKNVTAEDVAVTSLNVNDKASIDENGVATFGTTTGDTTTIENGAVTAKSVTATTVTAEDVTADTVMARNSADLGKFHIAGNTMTNSEDGTSALIIEGISLANGEMSGITKFDGVAVGGSEANGLTFGTDDNKATLGKVGMPFSSKNFSVSSTGVTDVYALQVNGTERISTTGDGTLNSLLIGTQADPKAQITADGVATVKSLNIGTTGYGFDANGVIKGADNSVIGGVTLSDGAVTAPNGGTIANAVFTGDSIDNKESGKPLTIEGVELKDGTIKTEASSGAATTINQGSAEFKDGTGKITTISSGGAIYNGGGEHNTTAIDGGMITTELLKANRIQLGTGAGSSVIDIDSTQGAASFGTVQINPEGSGNVLLKSSDGSKTAIELNRDEEKLVVGSATNNQTIITKGELDATATAGTNVNHRVSTASEDTTTLTATGFTGLRTIQSTGKQIQDSLRVDDFTANRTMDGTAQTVTDVLTAGTNTVSEVKSIGTPSNTLTVKTDESHSNSTTDLANESTQIITDGQTTATATQSLTTFEESLVNGDKKVSDTKEFGATHSTLKDTNVAITTDSVLNGEGGVPTTKTVLSKGAPGAAVTNTLLNTNLQSSITLADEANTEDVASMSLDRGTYTANLKVASDATNFVEDTKTLTGFGTTLQQGTNKAVDTIQLTSAGQYAKRTLVYNGVTTLDTQDVTGKKAETSVTEGDNTVSDVLDLAQGEIVNTVTKDGKTTTTKITTNNFAITGSAVATGKMMGTTSVTDDASEVTAGAEWTGKVGLALNTTTGETTLRTATNGYTVLNGGKASFVSQSGTNYVDINDGILTVVNNDTTGIGKGSYANKRVTTITGGKVTTDTLYVDSLIFGESLSSLDPTSPSDSNQPTAEGNYIKVDGSASLANGKFKVSQDGYVTNIFPHATDAGFTQYVTTFKTNPDGVKLSYADKDAQTLSYITVGKDESGADNSIIYGLTSTDPMYANTKNTTTTVLGTTTHVIATETASNTMVQTAERTAGSLTGDGKSIESVQSIAGDNVVNTSTLTNGTNTIMNTQTVAADKATASTVVKDAKGQASSTLGSGQAMTAVKDANGQASNTLVGGQATTEVKDKAGKSSKITTTAEAGTVFTNDNAKAPFVDNGAVNTTIKGNTITTGQITTDKLVITGNHSATSDGQGNGDGTPGGAVVIAGDGTFSSKIAGVDNTSLTSELSNTVNGVVASASDGMYTGTSNVTAKDVTNSVSNSDGTVESSMVNTVDENGKAMSKTTVKDVAGTNSNVETSTASTKTITGLGDNAGKVASRTLNLDQAQTKLVNGEASNTVTRELAKTSDILTDGTKTNSVIRTLDDSMMSLTNGTATNRIVHNVTSSTQTFSNGSKTSTITTNSDGMTVTTNDKTTTVSGEDVVIKKGTSEEVKLSDLGKVQKLVDGLKPADGSGDGVSVVDSLNTEYQQRVAADEALNNRVTKLNQQVDRVGALAAAMSTLEPLPYDKEAPTTINAAIGTYKGESAVAIGVNHYRNQDTMLTFKIGKSGSDTMAGFGASFRVGRKSPQQIIEDERAKAERQVAAAQERALAAHRLYEETIKALEAAKKVAEENQQLQIQEAAKSEQAAKERLEQVKAEQNKELAPSYQVK